MTDNPAENVAKALEKDLRDPALHPAPTTVKTNPGPTPTNSQMNGSEQVEKTETGALWPEDHTPWGLKKKSGPVSGTVSGGTIKPDAAGKDTGSLRSADVNPDTQNSAPGDEGVQPN